MTRTASGRVTMMSRVSDAVDILRPRHAQLPTAQVPRAPANAVQGQPGNAAVLLVARRRGRGKSVRTCVHSLRTLCLTVRSAVGGSAGEFPLRLSSNSEELRKL